MSSKHDAMLFYMMQWTWVTSDHGETTIKMMACIKEARGLHKSVRDYRKLITCRSTNVLPGATQECCAAQRRWSTIWWAQPKCGDLYATSIVESGQSYRPRKVMYPTNDITATCMVLLVTCPRVNSYVHISIWSHPDIGNKNAIFCLSSHVFYYMKYTKMPSVQNYVK